MAKPEKMSAMYPRVFEEMGVPAANMKRIGKNRDTYTCYMGMEDAVEAYRARTEPRMFRAQRAYDGFSALRGK